MGSTIFSLILLLNLASASASAAAAETIKGLRISEFKLKGVTACHRLVLSNSSHVVTFDGSHGKFQMTLEDLESGSTRIYVTRDFYCYGGKGLVNDILPAVSLGPVIDLQFAGVGIERPLQLIVNESVMTYAPTSGMAVFEEVR